MKMNYLLKSKPKHEYRFKIILVVTVFVILSAIAFLFNKGTRNVFTTIARPFWNVGEISSNGFNNVINFFHLQSSLISKNKDLQNQIGTLNLKLIDYDIVTKENQDLKGMFGRIDTTNRILSRILSKPPQSPYDTIVIDVGSRDGVNMGNKVYISDNIIVGTITSVAPHTSLVELFSDGDKKQVVVLERTGASYDLVGSGGANMTIQVPKEADILWGDIFTYPGLTPSVIGSVYYIDTNSQSSFKTVFLRIPGNIFQVKWVFVERGL